VRVLDTDTNTSQRQYQKRHTFSTKPKRNNKGGEPNRRLSDPLYNSVVPQSSNQSIATAPPTSRTTEEIINTAEKVPARFRQWQDGRQERYLDQHYEQQERRSSYKASNQLEHLSHQRQLMAMAEQQGGDNMRRSSSSGISSGRNSGSSKHTPTNLVGSVEELDDNEEDSPFHMSVTRRTSDMTNVIGDEMSTGNKTAHSSVGMISVEMMDLNIPPDEIEDGDMENVQLVATKTGGEQTAPTATPPRRPSLSRQQSRRKARDRSDFRTSLSQNPNTRSFLANDDDPHFWGVSNRWFADAGEFVGELAGMATKRASDVTNASNDQLPLTEGREIVHAVDDMDTNYNHNDTGKQMGGVSFNEEGLDFSNRDDDNELFDDLSSLGDTPTGIFTDMTRRQVIRGAWAISVSFMIAWIAAQVALQHSTTFQGWTSGIHKHQIVFTPRRSKRYGQIKAQLVDISGEEVFMDEASPQHRALLYLADGDTLVLDPHDEHVRPQLLQRYALAVFYFATGGSEWKSRTYWLTERHECGWLFVICSEVDEDGNITDREDVADDDYSNKLDSELTLEEGKTVTGLSLYGQNLRGQIPHEIVILEHLHVLDLGNNHLSGIIGAEFGKLQHLHKVYLQDNALHGGLEAMAWLTSLKRLYVENNRLTGTLPFDLGKLKHLEELRVGQNQLTGHIPSVLFRSETLTKLDLHSNQFTGEIDIHEKSILEYLYLFNNKMSGALTSDHLCSVSDTLIDLRLNNNSFTGKIPRLDCTMDKLELLSLGENDLTGSIPNMLGGKLPELKELHLYENRLISTIPKTIFDPEQLTAVLLGNNELTGSLTADMVDGATNLAHLYVNSNRLSGNLDDFAQATNLDSLQKLRLEFNDFTGSIPKLNMLDTLELLYLYNNSFTGTLDNLGDATKLRKLKLSNNTFEGEISSELGELKHLEVLSLNGNKFVGTLPPQFEQLSALEELRVENNDISGDVPLGVCKLRKSTLGLFSSDCGGKLPEFSCSCCTECI